MSIADAFKAELERAVPILPTNEWAITEAREQVALGLSSHDAFNGIVEVVRLSADQDDVNLFSSCVRLALDLIRISDTPQIPMGLEAALEALTPVAAALGCTDELPKVRSKYHLPPNHSMQKTSQLRGASRSNAPPRRFTGIAVRFNERIAIRMKLAALAECCVRVIQCLGLAPSGVARMGPFNRTTAGPEPSPERRR